MFVDGEREYAALLFVDGQRCAEAEHSKRVGAVPAQSLLLACGGTPARSLGPRRVEQRHTRTAHQQRRVHGKSLPFCYCKHSQ